MSTDGRPWESCAAYGCPLLGAIGVAGQWFCACHFRHPATAFDAITAELHRNSRLCADVTLARREGAGYGEIKEMEDVLIELTYDLGRQYSIPTAGVVGPTHGEHAPTESDA